MIKLAIYGKGGIGKSTCTANLAAAFATLGKRVIQIGCDPKADSTINLLGGTPVTPVMDYMREHDDEPTSIEEISQVGFGGILCIETGGPTPGLGCAGRGIITTFALLEELELFDRFKPDVVLYDVLGDVVCGGFSMPMRKGFADKIFVVCSGEKMSRYAAANICMAVDNFKGRGYASLGGIILNRRGVPDEDEAAAELAADFGTSVIGAIDRSEDIPLAEEKGVALVASDPNAAASQQLKAVADSVYGICGGE